MERQSSSTEQQNQYGSAGQFAQSSRPWMTERQATAACVAGGGAAMALGVVSGAALGAAAMYLLDPDKGPDRRHHLADVTADALETTTEAVRHGWDVAGDKITHAGTALAASMPSRRQMRKSGRRLWHSASDSASAAGHTASDWLESASSYVPALPRRRSSGGWFQSHSRDHDVSATTAGLTSTAALLVGVGAMWLFDPQRGRSRRAWLGQKATRVLHETGDFMRATGRHLRNKSKGYYHETRKAVDSARDHLGSGQHPYSTGQESSAQNTLQPGGVAIAYGVVTTSSEGECPPGTTPISGT